MNYLKTSFLRTMLLSLLPAGAMAQTIQTSDAEQEYWYRICSASGESCRLAITDNMANDAATPLTLEPVSETDDAQQWKLLAEGEGVVFVNRATGHVLQPASTAAPLFNLTQLQMTLVPGRSFVLSELGEGQTAISGAEADGTVRYLVAQHLEQASKPATEAQANTPFAWTFTLAQNIATTINGAAVASPRIKVTDGCISIEPAQPFCVYTIDGALVDATRSLAPGIYVVATAYYKTRVLVK